MRSFVRNLLVISGAVLIVALVAYSIYTVVGHKSTGFRRAPKISLIPAAPPPPPPPKEEKKPDPPKEQKEVKIEPVTPKDAPAPPSQDLKMEGPAGDGPSAFQAGKVTREDIGNLGPANGGGTGLANPFTNYATAIKGELQRYLSRNKELRQRAYRVELQLWVGRDGLVSRQELLGSTGDSELDGLIRQAIASMGAFKQPPPERMPQPIRLRLVTAGH